MFTKTKKVADIYDKRGELHKKETDWGAVFFWGFIGLMILGAIAS